MHFKKFAVSMILLFVLAPMVLAEGSVDSPSSYELLRVIEVEGRQGIATDGETYFVSSSTALYRYSKTGELLSKNESALIGLPQEANHIGDIDVYNDEIYAGIEQFMDGQGQNIQIAIYDANTLEYRRSMPWEPNSGQVEVSGVAIDPGGENIWLTDWVNGRYLYRYDLKTGEYRGKLHLRASPQWQQGVAYRDGHLYITADDGDAEDEEIDNLWRVPAETVGTVLTSTPSVSFGALVRSKASVSITGPAK